MTSNYFLRLKEGKLYSSDEDKFIASGFAIFMIGMLALYGCSNLPARSADSELIQSLSGLKERVELQDKKIADLEVLLHNMQLEVTQTRKRGNGVALGLGRVTQRINRIEKRVGLQK